MTAGIVHIDMGILVDPLASLMLVIVTAVSLLVQIYSLGYMKGDPGFGRFFAYLSLFSFSMLTLVLADNFILLYMGWELVGLCSYLLIGFWYQKPEAASAAKKAFVVNRVGDFGFLIGILVLSILAGTLSFDGATRFIAGGGLSGAQVTLIALLLFCGAIGKSGQFPLHVWLPDAMEGPTPVSALIHSATMVAAGVFMVARLYGIFMASADALRLIASLGAFTAVFAALIALAQDDIKRILAYSTISQLGYMMLALGVGGYAAGVFHLTTHAAFKTLLFLGAGSVIHAVGTNDIWKMGGLGRRMPVTAITFFIAVLAIAGIFPLSGFWSKDEILQAARASGHPELYVPALVTVFLTAFYMARLFFVAFAGESRSESHAHESPVVMTVPLVILGLLCGGPRGHRHAASRAGYPRVPCPRGGGRPRHRYLCRHPLERARRCRDTGGPSHLRPAGSAARDAAARRRARVRRSQEQALHRRAVHDARAGPVLHDHGRLCVVRQARGGRRGEPGRRSIEMGRRSRAPQRDGQSADLRPGGFHGLAAALVVLFFSLAGGR